MQRATRYVVVATVAAIMGMSAGCDSATGKGNEQSAAGKRKRTAAGSMKRDNMESMRSESGYDITPLSRKAVATLAKKLDPDTYTITQKDGTERAFTGALLENKKEGVYACVVCGLPIFSSAHKFKSGTGWPSFYREFDPQHISRNVDRTLGMVRTEINCARCDSHLGHLFDDGPQPTGERHCLNSASLRFYENGADLPAESRPTADEPQAAGGVAETETAYFAGGCFWGIEHYFQQGPGVLDASSGYMQGRTNKPSYEQVCSATTGHAETVKVVFDPSKITFRRLLEAFFVMHNPTELNFQGPDVGPQYRSGIWYASESQKQQAQAYIKELESDGPYQGRKIVTVVEPAKKFFPAEDYHQDYVAKTGRACHVRNPW